MNSQNSEKDENSVFKPPPNPQNEDSSAVWELPQPLSQMQPPPDVFFLEVIKNGVQVLKHNLNKNVITFGRSRDCDFPLDHPSISRYHSALLWKEDENDSSNNGFFYVMDLNSTHGTFLNKQKLQSRTCVKIMPGNNVLRFGGSSRIFMVDAVANDNDQLEDESSNEEKAEENFCTWGIADDEVDDNDGDQINSHTPLGTVLALLQTDLTSSSSPNDNVYRENPQKILQQWFEREGYDYEYKINCINGKFKCTFELPIDGQDVTLEGSLFPKKKESIVDACLKACKLLDKAELLFPWQAQKNNLKRKEKESDSEDDLLDETEEGQKKRLRKESKNETVTAETFETLSEKWKKISVELRALKAKLASMTVAKKCEIQKDKTDVDNADSLDSFMKTLDNDESRRKENVFSSINSKIQKSKLRMKISGIEKEQKRVERLMKLAKPNFSFKEILSSVEEHTRPEFEEKKPDRNPVPKSVIKAKIESILKKKEPTLESSDINISKTTPEQTPKPKMSVAEVFKDDDETIVKSKPKLEIPSSRIEEPKFPNKSKTIRQEKKFVKDEDTYIEWMPPVSQSGDGRTALNDKYGY
ncbi:hypothetical protein B4U79_04635 [Dinothrombium tinctorium]|uniref:FHA domain-containing protein n=1 Tax=Dinothrombium tinctorium TaxID=1965070 RepID=A0A443QHG9_9ACAR|nr:hypothetical protein B4U79_08092 [Dinothrombium tinctorium]RWS04334.1 hypothetical protein B4U79_04635 [Dinothrombium tinctorium]